MGLLLYLLDEEEGQSSGDPQPSVSRSNGGWDPYYYKKRKKPVSVGPFGDDWTPPPVEPPRIAPARPYVPQGWASNLPLMRLPPRPAIDLSALRAEQEQRRLEAIAAQRAREEEDDEEVMLLLAA